jgi:hypothetical protein
MNAGVARLIITFAFGGFLVPGLAGAQVEEGISTPTTRTVTGTDIGHYTNGTLPVDLSGVTVAAYVPNGTGGYNVLSGVGTNSGTFSIPNVPSGPYLLQLGSSFLVSSNTVVDEDFDSDYRSNGVPANSSTLVTFDLANLESWQSTDIFEIVCPNNGVYNEFDGTLGETSFVGTFPYAQFIPENLSDASQGDRYVILQLSTQTVGGLPFTAAARALFPPKFTQKQGSDTPINGNLETLPQKYEFVANINGADLTAQAMAANPNATLIGTDIYLDAFPGNPAHGERTGTPDLVAYNLSFFGAGPNITTNTDFGKIPYGNPFPAAWPLFDGYAWLATTNYTAPGATNSAPWSTLVDGVNTTLPTSTSPIKPLVGVVTNPTINGQNFFVDQTGVGLTPTLKWSPPSLGRATFYEVDIVQFSNIGGNTIPTAVITVRTQITVLTIPQGLMSAGQGYAFVIRAWYVPGLNFTKTPFMSGPVSAFTDVISGLMQP